MVGCFNQIQKVKSASFETKKSREGERERGRERERERERDMISTIQIKEIIPHRNNIRNKLFLFRRRICGVGKR